MRHHGKHIPRRIADAGNISQGSIWICIQCYGPVLIAIPESYLAIGFQFIKRSFICVISSFPMSNGYLENIFTIIFYKNILSNELLICISQENTRQQTGFTQYLEAIANSQHLPPVICELDNALHHRAEPGKSATTQVM